MALHELLRAIERDAASEASAVLDAARAAAAALEAEAARERTELVARTSRQHADVAQRAADARIAAAERAARTRVLAARAEMLERVRGAIAAQLPARADAMRDTLARAAVRFGEGTRRDEPTGVTIELPSGTRVVATLAALVDRDWPQLAAAIVAEVQR